MGGLVVLNLVHKSDYLYSTNEGAQLRDREALSGAKPRELSLKG